MSNLDPATDAELAAAVKAFHDERAEAGIVIAQAFSRAEAINGVVTVTYDTELSGVSREVWLAVNQFENLAQFACNPFSWSTEESTRLRQAVERVDTFLVDATPLGSLDNAGIRALNSLEK